ncbi:hypothetical protein ABGB07_02350 [Micromonosporaceae bacterium B7E4]
MNLSAKERIRRAGPTTKTVRVWLGADLDLLEQYEAAQRELEEAQKPATSLAGNGPTGNIQARLDALRAQLDEYAMDFRLRGLADGRFRRLLEEHKPRRAGDEIHPHDNRGWNAATFPGALVKASTVSPELDEDDWFALLGDEDTDGLLTSTQLDELAAAAYRLSRVEVDIPFSPAGSPTNPSFGRE